MAKLSRDQKRKKKLDERNRRARQQPSLAYDGDKYKTEDLAFLWLSTETGIYQAFVMSDRQLDDRTVSAAVEALILKLRAGTLPPLETPDEVTYQRDQPEDLVIQRIHANWEQASERGDRLLKEDQIGVLRSILGTIQDRRNSGPRGYLLYIETFLTRKAGVTVQKVPAPPEAINTPSAGLLSEVLEASASPTNRE